MKVSKLLQKWNLKMDIMNEHSKNEKIIEKIMQELGASALQLQDLENWKDNIHPRYCNFTNLAVS